MKSGKFQRVLCYQKCDNLVAVSPVQMHGTKCTWFPYSNG